MKQRPLPVIEIRKAAIEDSQTIADFNFLMALETENKQLDKESLLKGVRGLFENTGRGFYLVALAGGEIVGQMMCTYEWSDWRNSDFWWIQSVFVKKEFRGSGVFKQLYKTIERLAKEAGACGLRLYVEKENSSAQKVYWKMGMSETAYKMFEEEF